MLEKILIVEDEESTVQAVKECLKPEGFRVVAAWHGRHGLRAVTEERPDLVVLDLILPDLDGLEICRRIRQDPTTARPPILILSAKGEEVDKVVGLHVGADDYMVKPFGPKELVARVKALLRRSGETSEAVVLKAGDIELDPDRYTVRVGGNAVALTTREFDLFKALLEVKGRVLTREYLLGAVWGRDRNVGIDTRTVDVHIRSLRSKLGREARRLLTVRNVGYRCDLSPEGPASKLSSNDGR